jgi:FtsZ-interacting cell division protein ZipA
MNSLELPHIGLMLMATVMAGSLGLVFVVWWANRKKEEKKAETESAKGKKGKASEKTKDKSKGLAETQTKETAQSEEKAAPKKEPSFIRRVYDAVKSVFTAAAKWFGFRAASKALVQIPVSTPPPAVHVQAAAREGRETVPEISSALGPVRSRPLKNVTPPREQNDAMLPALSEPGQSQNKGRAKTR